MIFKYLLQTESIFVLVTMYEMGGGFALLDDFIRSSTIIE